MPNQATIWTMDLSASGIYNALPTSCRIRSSSEDNAVWLDQYGYEYDLC